MRTDLNGVQGTVPIFAARGTVPIFAARPALPCQSALPPRKWDCPLWVTLTLVLGAILISGCGDYEPAAPPTPAAPKAEAPQAAAAAAPTVEKKAAESAVKTAPPKADAGPAPKEQPQAAGEGSKPEQRKAEFGVGARGHDYGPGVLTTPLSVYFTIQERMAFTIKIPAAMNLFKATENRVPKSQEEYMQRIIKDNDIELPTLRYGDRYVYDPKTGELMVETKRASAEPKP